MNIISKESIYPAILVIYLGFFGYSFQRVSSLERDPKASNENFVVFIIVTFLSLVDFIAPLTYLFFGIFIRHPIFTIAWVIFFIPMLNFARILIWTTGVISLIKCKLRFLQVFFFYPSRQIRWLTRKNANPATDDGVTSKRTEPFFKFRTYDTPWKLAVLFIIWVSYIVYQSACLLLFSAWCYIYATIFLCMFVPFAFFYQTKGLYDMKFYTYLMNIWIWRTDSALKEHKQDVTGHDQDDTNHKQKSKEESDKLILLSSPNDYFPKDKAKDEGEEETPKHIKINHTFDYAIMNSALTAETVTGIGFVLIIMINSSLKTSTEIDISCVLAVGICLILKYILYIVVKFRCRKMFKSIPWYIYWYSGTLFMSQDGNTNIRCPWYREPKRKQYEDKRTQVEIKRFEKTIDDVLQLDPTDTNQSKSALQCFRGKAFVFHEFLKVLDRYIDKVEKDHKKTTQVVVKQPEEKQNTVTPNNLLAFLHLFSCKPHAQDIKVFIDETNEFKDFLKEMENYADGFEDLLAYVLYEDYLQNIRRKDVSPQGFGSIYSPTFEDTEYCDILQSFFDGMNNGIEAAKMHIGEIPKYVVQVEEAPQTSFFLDPEDPSKVFLTRREHETTREYRDRVKSRVLTLHGSVYTLPPSDFVLMKEEFFSEDDLNADIQDDIGDASQEDDDNNDDDDDGDDPDHDHEEGEIDGSEEVLEKDDGNDNHFSA